MGRVCLCPVFSPSLIEKYLLSLSYSLKRCSSWKSTTELQNSKAHIIEFQRRAELEGVDCEGEEAIILKEASEAGFEL